MGGFIQGSRKSMTPEGSHLMGSSVWGWGKRRGRKSNSGTETRGALRLSLRKGLEKGSRKRGRRAPGESS